MEGLLSDLENNNISDEDLFKLIESISIYSLDIPELQKNELTHLPKGWKVLSVNKDLKVILVVSGYLSGYIPMEINPDSNWECPTCHKYGPWDGNKCLSCGRYSYPE